MENLHDQREISRAWRVSRSLFYRLRRLPDWPEPVRLGRRTLYRETDLSAFLERHTGLQTGQHERKQKGGLTDGGTD